MSNKTQNTIIGVLITIVILFSFLIGYNTYPKWNTPITVNDTIFKVDTVEHTIVDTFPWFVVKRDTIIYRDTITREVDTAVILREYFATHYYSRTWQDSSVIITVDDAVSENKLIDQVLKYEITRPQSIVNVSQVNYSYSRYLYAGIRADYKGAGFGLFYADRRALYGLGYNPFNRNIELGFQVIPGPLFYSKSDKYHIEKVKKTAKHDFYHFFRIDQ